MYVVYWRYVTYYTNFIYTTGWPPKKYGVTFQNTNEADTHRHMPILELNSQNIIKTLYY